MAPPTSGLSATLQALTLTKIAEIDKQRKKYEAKKQDILTGANSSDDQREKVAQLLSGVKDFVPGASSNPTLSNIRRWLDQSRVDSSIPPTMLESFEKQLKTMLDHQT